MTGLVTYQVEAFQDCWPEVQVLAPLHYDEIAADKDHVPMDVDVKQYEALQNDGQLHFVTVRVDGKLVGYHVTIVKTHLHYKSTLMGFTDLYFLLKEYRKNNVGRGMFHYVEETLKKRGVTKLLTGTKCHQDHSALFLHMGWTHTENLFTKVIKGD